jgi:prolyl-tRNA editing enzyme YbaK/EbsC (Cys-tRNA(Pro) deacylase)
MNLNPQAMRVQKALDMLGLKLEVVELPDSTRTSAEAAQALGCLVGQIAKSIIFQAQPSHNPILVIASGSNRVNEKLIAGLLGEEISKADAEFVHNRTGFTIGGVPPIGHIMPLRTFIDQDLLQYTDIWAAAGTPHAVFHLTPTELLGMTGGEVVAVTE